MIYEGTVNQHLNTGAFIPRVKGDEFVNVDDWHTVPIIVHMKNHNAFKGNYFMTEEDKAIYALMFGYDSSLGKVSLDGGRNFISRSYNFWRKTIPLGIHHLTAYITRAWYHVADFGDRYGFKYHLNTNQDFLVEIITNAPNARTLGRPPSKIGQNEYWTRLEFTKVSMLQFEAIEYAKQTLELLRDDLRLHDLQTL